MTSPLAEAGDIAPCQHDDEPIVVEWELGRADAPLLVVSSRVGQPVPVTLTATAALGPLRYAWTIGEVDLGVGESQVVQVDIPPEAFLGPEAVRYVTDLVVRARSPRGIVVMEPVFVAWPNPAEPALTLVWNRADMSRNAPYGVLDPLLRQQVERLPVVPERATPSIQVPVEDLGLEDTGLGGGI